MWNENSPAPSEIQTHDLISFCSQGVFFTTVLQSMPYMKECCHCLIVTRLAFQIPGHLPPSRVSSPLLKDESSHLGFALRLDCFSLVLLTLAVLQQGSYHQRFIGSIRNRGSQNLLNDNTEGGFYISPYYPLSYSWSFSHSCLHRLASWFELGSQVGLTTDHLSSCCQSITANI